MAEATKEALRATSLMPSLTVNELNESLKFFKTLGFEIEDRWEENGKLLGATLKANRVRIGLSQDDGKKGSNREKGVGMRMYFEAETDIDRLAANVKAAGIPLKGEPHDTEWGSRAFDVVEPSGFLLTIGTPGRD